MGYKDYEVQKKYQREWRARRRAEFMADKTCANCSSRDRLELDHVDPSVKVAHNIWSWSSERRAVEVAKCQILCHNCHKVKTLQQRKKAQHGSGQMYQGHGCRCDECRKWKKESDAKYRPRKNAREVRDPIANRESG